MTSYHLLLIEDDASVAKGLKAGLEQAGFAVRWTGPAAVVDAACAAGAAVEAAGRPCLSLP